MSSDTKDTKKETGTTKSGGTGSKVTTLDDRIAELENKSIASSNSQSLTKPEQKPLLAPEEVKSPTVVSDQEPKKDTDSVTEQKNKLVSEPVAEQKTDVKQESVKENIYETEVEERSHKTMLAFVSGVILGALITSIFV
jgi:predicted Zn-dependent protease